MRTGVKYYILVIILLLSVGTIDANSIKFSNQAKISILTCSPTVDEVYALYGHTGIRVKDDSLAMDVVFDYGLFDFSSNNFIFRFIKGETDYMLGTRTFDHFMFEYYARGVGVEEQVLKFTPEQINEVGNFLFTNALPQNRVYRYNFLTENCSTKPRDIVENAFDQTIEYIPDGTEQTYRDLINESLILNQWVRFGINLIIGAKADKPITQHQKAFLPRYLHRDLDNASYTDPTTKETILILSSSTSLTNPEGKAKELIDAMENHTYKINYPLYIGWILLLLTLVITVTCEVRGYKWLGYIFDYIVFIVSFILGCIVFYLMFFSLHPCVSYNLNLMWLNPLPILFLIFFLFKSTRNYAIYYHFINFVLIFLFIILQLFKIQIVELAVIPYVLILLVRSLSYVYRYRRIM